MLQPILSFTAITNSHFQYNPLHVSPMRVNGAFTIDLSQYGQAKTLLEIPFLWFPQDSACS